MLLDLTDQILIRQRPIWGVCHVHALFTNEHMKGKWFLGQCTSHNYIWPNLATAPNSPHSPVRCSCGIDMDTVEGKPRNNGTCWLTSFYDRADAVSCDEHDFTAQHNPDTKPKCLLDPVSPPPHSPGVHWELFFWSDLNPCDLSTYTHTHTYTLNPRPAVFCATNGLSCDAGPLLQRDSAQWLIASLWLMTAHMQIEALLQKRPNESL